MSDTNDANDDFYCTHDVKLEDGSVAVVVTHKNGKRLELGIVMSVQPNNVVTSAPAAAFYSSLDAMKDDVDDKGSIATAFANAVGKIAGVAGDIAGRIDNAIDELIEAYDGECLRPDGTVRRCSLMEAVAHAVETAQGGDLFENEAGDKAACIMATNVANNLCNDLSGDDRLTAASNAFACSQAIADMTKACAAPAPKSDAPAPVAEKPRAERPADLQRYLKFVCSEDENGFQDVGGKIHTTALADAVKMVEYGEQGEMGDNPYGLSGWESGSLCEVGEGAVRHIAYQKIQARDDANWKEAGFTD